MTRDQVIQALKLTRTGTVDLAELKPLGFPPLYLDIIAEVGVQEIASDFILPPSMHIVVENLRVSERSHGWLVFAISASDLWLLRRDAADDQVAYLASDVEAGRFAVPLGISLCGWFDLALYMQRHENAQAKANDAQKRKLKATAKADLEKMSVGLSQRYPYML